MLALVLLLPPTHSVQAKTYDVLPTDTKGLIEAINKANANPGPDTINLYHSTYNIGAVNNGTNGANGLPVITSDITINGDGSTIERNQFADAFRIFHVGKEGKLTLNKVTIKDGKAEFSEEIPGDGSGGGISNLSGEVTLNDSTIVDCTAQGEGGGINNTFGTVRLNNSTIEGGLASSGGGIQNRVGNVEVKNSSFVNNSVTRLNSGGGIKNFAGTITIEGSTFSGNKAPDGKGSAIFSHGSFDGKSKVTIENSTLKNNQAGSGTVFNGEHSEINIGHVLMTGNQGGAVVDFSDETVRLKSSIVADQLSGPDCSGFPPISLGYNLDSDGTCNLNSPGDKPNNPNANLGPLQNNGGPTQTSALLPGSAAIDTIPVASCTGLDGIAVNADQRGFSRPVDGDVRCDMGPFEVQGARVGGTTSFLVDGSGSAGLIAGLAAGAAVVFAASGWYATRRWLGNRS